MSLPPTTDQAFRDKGKISLAPGSFLYGQALPTAAYSICIPTFARPELLRAAVSSAVAQDFTGEWEVLICENPSDDRTLAVAREFDARRVRLWRNQVNVGMVENWNQCLMLASAPWVSILHDDDLLAPGFLSACDRHLRDHPAPAALFGRSCLGGEPPVRWPATKEVRFAPIAQREFLLTNPISFPGVCVRREVALGEGGFDTGLHLSADYGLWARLCAAGGIWRSDVDLSFYRIGLQQTAVGAATRLAGDFRRAQDRVLREAGCGAVRRRALTFACGLLVDAYFRRTYAGRLGVGARIKTRLAGWLKTFASVGLTARASDG